MPIEIPHVQAITFYGPITTGRTRPGIFECMTDQKERYEYIVKFRGSLGRRTLYEFVAALLGYHMDLPIPPIACVEIPPAMATYINDDTIKEHIAADNGPHFGSQRVDSGFNILPTNWPVNNHHLYLATSIFVFDMLTQNPDRSFIAGKPNTLIKGDQLWFIDHELAFSFIDAIGWSKEPWQLHGEPFVKAHIFYKSVARAVKSNDVAVDSVLQVYSRNLAGAISDVRRNLPPQWQDDVALDKIVLHLEKIGNNLDLFEQGLLEALQ